MSGTLHGFGLGVASENANGDILDVFSGAERVPIGPSADALRAVSGTLDDAALSSLAKDCRALMTSPQQRSQRGSEIVGEEWLHQH